MLNLSTIGYISVIVVFSIVVDIVRFISLTILVPPGNTSVSRQSTQSNNDVDEVVDKATTGELWRDHERKGTYKSVAPRNWKIPFMAKKVPMISPFIA